MRVFSCREYGARDAGSLGAASRRPQVDVVGGAPCSLTRPLVQPAGQVGHAPLQPVDSERCPLICLPGRVPSPLRLGAVLTDSLEDTLGRVKPAARGVERLLGVFAGGLGFG
jgi:hypothetical protein